MKLWFVTALALILFSGCSSRTQALQLQKQNAQQALLIQQQRAQIDTLNEKLKAKAKTKKRSALPPAPKKNIKLKKVEDNNYSSNYMYPGAPKKKPVKVAQTTKAKVGTTMDKAQCINMIGADKFAKYTEMFGSESASIKRCAMLQAMK